MDRGGLYKEKDARFLVHSEIHCNQVFLTDVEVLQRRIIKILLRNNDRITATLFFSGDYAISFTKPEGVLAI